MPETVYIETSIPSYLTARPSRDVRTAAWQQLTIQWWEEARPKYELVTSELVIAEASRGDPDAAECRLASLEGMPELLIDQEVMDVAQRLISEGGILASAQADAIHVAVAAVGMSRWLLKLGSGDSR